jgi:hypothetical protein
MKTARSALAHRIVYTLMASSLLFVLATLSGCTFIKHKDFMVLDLHPTGEALDLHATLEGKGSLDVNREQGSAEGMVSEVVDAVSPSLLP